MCLKQKIHFLSKFRRKILIFEEIRAFSIHKGLTWKNGPKFDHVVKNRVWGPKFETYFSCSWMNFRNSHTNSKGKNYFAIILFQIEIAVGTLCLPPKANRVKKNIGRVPTTSPLIILVSNIYVVQFEKCSIRLLRNIGGGGVWVSGTGLLK